jgi:hypothetical protein
MILATGKHCRDHYNVLEAVIRGYVSEFRGHNRFYTLVQALESFKRRIRVFLEAVRGLVEALRMH